jgi:ATP-dependent DNA helicase PIF1
MYILNVKMSSKEKKLSEEQQKVFDKITEEKKNIFFTGCAGTGKSFLIREIIDYFTTTIGPESVAVTASTGRAAFSIGGTTLHSFAGIGLGKEDTKTLIGKAMFNKKVTHRWNTTQVLIIDEISMLDAEYFDKLNQLGRALRKSSKPFGGVQLILTGDLLQLPPVNDGNDRKKRIFEADCWKDCIKEYIVLYQVFRQEDIEFAEVLTYIRLGAVNDDIIAYIEKLSEEKQYDSESGPVNLYATRARADRFNRENLDKLEGDIKIYSSFDKYKSKSSGTNALNTCPAVASLELKINAQVMLIKNINRYLVNGTVGTVIGFTEVFSDSSITVNNFQVESLPIVRFDLADGRLFTRVVGRETWSQTLPTGEEIASRRQIPLILAWAVTIHKSQGQTIQRLKVDLSDIFESGQIYTALSRAVSPDTLQVVGFNPDKILVDHESLQFCIENELV